MQMKPAQIVGLIAIVVLGGVMAWLFAGEARDPAPGETSMRGLPGRAIPPVEPMAPRSPTGAASGVAANPASAGSAEAKDDLYCQGLIQAAHRAASDPANPADRRRILLVPALASAGADKLIKEGVATRETTAIFADAHSEIARADFTAGKPRISLAACEARAEAVLKTLGR